MTVRSAKNRNHIGDQNRKIERESRQSGPGALIADFAVEGGICEVRNAG